MENNVEVLLAELKIKLGVKNNGDIASMLGMSVQNFSNKLKRGTIGPDLMELAEKHGISTVLSGFTATDSARAELVSGGGSIIPPEILDQIIANLEYAYAHDKELFKLMKNRIADFVYDLVTEEPNK